MPYLKDGDRISIMLEKGNFIRHTSCTNPKCGSSDAMALYEHANGVVDGTCFSCGHYDPNPLQSSTPLPSGHEKQEESKEVIQFMNVNGCKSMPIRPLSDRGIDYDTCEFYGVRVVLDETDGTTPTQHLSPY